MQTPAGQLGRDHLEIVQAVIDHQDLVAGQHKWRLTGLQVLRVFGSTDMDIEMKDRSSIDGAFRPHAAAHQLAQAAADREPQTGATVAAGGGCIRLGERFKNPVELLWLDSNPGVVDSEGKQESGL